MEKPEFTEEQIAFFRECGRRGGLSRTVTERSRKASSKVMNRYWKEVRAGKRKHIPKHKPKQQDLPLDPKE
jgi:hypothetical protein